MLKQKNLATAVLHFLVAGDLTKGRREEFMLICRSSACHASVPHIGRR